MRTVAAFTSSRRATTTAPTEGAFAAAEEWDDRIPIGLLYRAEGVPSYEVQVPALAGAPLVRRERLEASELEPLKRQFM